MSKNSLNKSELVFTKYQGAGNDFLLIDDRTFSFSPSFVPFLCDRHFGIGADGVLLLQKGTKSPFRMKIYNADGSIAKSCGNGLRCFVLFLKDLGVKESVYPIELEDQIVHGVILENNKVMIEIDLAAKIEKHIIEKEEVFYLDTGVPHAVVFSNRSLKTIGPFLEHHKIFSPQRTNVNLVKVLEDQTIQVQTWERGVGPTLACGTGAIAAACVLFQEKGHSLPIDIEMPGGKLQIKAHQNKLALIGEAKKVFEGKTFLTDLKKQTMG